MTAPANALAIVDESLLPAVPSESRARDGGSCRSLIVEDFIIGELAAGVTLSRICRELGISRTAVYDWRDADEQFAVRYAKARQSGFDAIAEKTLEIVDDPKINTKQARNMMDARLKLLAAWQSGTYANHLKVESSNRSLVVELSSDPVEAARQYQELMGS